MPTSVRVAARCIPTSHPSFLPQPSGFDSLSGFVIFHLLPTAENQNQNRQISRTAIGGRTFLHPGRFIVCFDSVIIYNRGTKPLLSANLPTSFGRRKTPLKKGRKRNLSLSSLRANSQHRDERFPSEIFPPPPISPPSGALRFLSPGSPNADFFGFPLSEASLAENRRLLPSSRGSAAAPSILASLYFLCCCAFKSGAVCLFWGGGRLEWGGAKSTHRIARISLCHRGGKHRSSAFFLQREEFCTRLGSQTFFKRRPSAVRTLPGGVISLKKKTTTTKNPGGFDFIILF